MIKLYHAPRTRSVRVLWLLEELGVPYVLERVRFVPPAARFFAQATPLGKLPVIEDGDVVMGESGAIVEYLVERYGMGRLAPPIGSPERGRFLQWLHFAESTAFPPLGILAWLTRYRDDAAAHATLIDDARERARAGFAVVAEALAARPYLVGRAFSAADVMMGFTLAAARDLGVLDRGEPHLDDYLMRLQARPAFAVAAAAERP